MVEKVNVSKDARTGKNVYFLVLSARRNAAVNLIALLTTYFTTKDKNRHMRKWLKQLYIY
tara:strand:- start:838 stop:1017 length:180 start_codon:yes stop_codon:yes gene_type:complete